MVNGVNFQAKPIFRGFSDRGYSIFEKNFTHYTLPKAKFILKNMVICSLCMLFIKSGEMLFIKRYNWFEIYKMRGTCNIVNMSKNWRKIWSHEICYTCLKYFLYLRCLGKWYILPFSFWHFCKWKYNRYFSHHVYRRGTSIMLLW